MRALKYYNETLYVTGSGNVYGVRQVGEYMYQIMCYTSHKLVAKGRLMTVSEVNYVLLSGRSNYIFNVNELIKCYREHNKK